MSHDNRESLMAGDTTVTEEEVTALCNQADSDGDGKVYFKGEL